MKTLAPISWPASPFSGDHAASHRHPHISNSPYTNMSVAAEPGSPFEPQVRTVVGMCSTMALMMIIHFVYLHSQQCS